MKRFILPALAVVLGLSISALAANLPSASPAPGKLVVHEWGTFTGLSASDGRHLPFRANIGLDLPSFVLTRDEQADRLNPALNAVLMKAFTKDETVALVRMETPVVYFYTDAPRELEARVDFPEGMLSEFYPPVREMTPAYDVKQGRSVLRGTSLNWGKLRIVPQSVSANYPKIEGKSHYAHARATDAATVQFSDRPGEVHEENFLFYRGLGDFRLPVALVAKGGDRFVLHNSSGAPISTAFLLRIENGKTRFATYRNLGAHQQMTIPSQPSADDLGEEMVDALVAEGLYEKEARAMVKTWESNWFGTGGTGTRVLYMLPRRTTDQVLPLRVAPTPDETVRVLVGRIDIITQEQETKLASMFPRAGTKGAITPDEAREMRALGRFLRPALNRAAEMEAWKVMRAIDEAVASAGRND